MAKEIEKLRKQGEASSRMQQEQKGMIRQLHLMLEQLLAHQAQNSSPSGPLMSDIATENSTYALDETKLETIKRSGANAGNFAAKLVVEMFPELFGLTNLRLRYNWYGGGNRQKGELCRDRKALIQRYVTYYYPESCAQS